MSLGGEQRPGFRVVAADDNEHAACKAYFLLCAQAAEDLEPANAAKQAGIGTFAENFRHLGDACDRRVERRAIDIETGRVRHDSELAQVGNGARRKLRQKSCTCSGKIPGMARIG